MSSTENAERPGRRASDLAHAVVDGTDGTCAVELSSARGEALKLKAQHAGKFWCSTEAGGCGGTLQINAGPVRVPYFRHQPGASCALAGDGRRAARSYEHLNYQRAFIEWLKAQGLTATMEHSFGPDGRADLHVVVESRCHTIEVQLSPIGVEDWQRRDENYRHHVDQVTWLYGPDAETPAATEQAHRGHALHIRGGTRNDSRIEIGVVTELAEHWSPLDECELRPEGLWTPRLDQALADLATAHQEAIALAAAERNREAQRQEEARRRASVWRSQPSKPHALPPRETHGGPQFGTLAFWKKVHPGIATWTPPQGWAWLDSLTDEDKAAARVLAFVVSRLYVSGPISMLSPSDALPGAEVVAALERAGFIELYERLGVARWQRIQAI